MVDSNFVLACRNCNRSMRVKNAFEWLLNGQYKTNQQQSSINEFRDRTKNFQNIREPSSLSGKEGNGKEGKVEEVTRQPPENKNLIFDVEKELLKNQIIYEKICMATGKQDNTAKSELRKFHLYLQEKERYPMTVNAAFAGFEKWLLNSKNFTKKEQTYETSSPPLKNANAR